MGVYDNSSESGLAAASGLERGPRRARLWWVALRLAGAVLLSFALGELLLRWILFGALFDGSALATKLRNPSLFAAAQRDELYWELQTRLLPPEKRGPPHSPDPQLGWSSGRFRSTSPRSDFPSETSKRLVLLYGDSYAQCNTGTDDCFEGLLPKSKFGTQLWMLNFGVGGYGLDQVLLALRSTVDQFVEDNPLVVIGIMIDDDLDRCALDYRCWPKPRFELVGGALELRPAPTMEEYWTQPRLSRTALLARLLLHSALSPSLADAWEDVDARTERSKALARAILTAILDELQARKLDHLVVLFFGSPSVLEPGVTSWREPLVREILESRGTPHVDTRAPMLAASHGDAAQVERLFGGSEALAGHFNLDGNRVAFLAFEEAFEHQFGLLPEWPPFDPFAFDATVTGGGRAVARVQTRPLAPFTAPSDTPRILLRVGPDGPTEVHYELRGRARSFDALARCVPGEGTDSSLVGVSVWLDARCVFSAQLRRRDPPLRIHADLEQGERMLVRVDEGGDGESGDALVLTDLRLE